MCTVVITFQINDVLTLLQAIWPEYMLSFEWKTCSLEVSMLSMVYVALVLTLLPILDLVVVPVLRHLMCHPSILKCVGIGGMLTLFSAVTMFALQGFIDRTSPSTEEQCIFFDSETTIQGNGPVSMYWMLLPVSIHAIAQIMLYVPSKSVHSYNYLFWDPLGFAKLPRLSL